MKATVWFTLSYLTHRLVCSFDLVQVNVTRLAFLTTDTDLAFVLEVLAALIDPPI